MSLGSLTTVFTPSPSCLAPANQWLINYSTGNGGWYDLFGPPMTSDCLPPNYTPASSAYYSPGRCPSGYTKATETIQQLSNAKYETIQTCCPRCIQYSPPKLGQERELKYSQRRWFHFTAASTSMTDQNTLVFPWLTSLHCKTSITTKGSATKTKSDKGVISTTVGSVYPGDNIGAYGIVVRFQDTDFPERFSVSGRFIFDRRELMVSQSTSSAQTTGTVPSTAPTTQFSGSSTPIPTSSSSALGSTSPSSTSGGMSTGTKAGIGAGVAAGMLALALALAIGYIMGQRRKKASSQAKAIHEPTVLSSWRSATRLASPNFSSGRTARSTSYCTVPGDVRQGSRLDARDGYYSSQVTNSQCSHCKKAKALEQSLCPGLHL